MKESDLVSKKYLIVNQYIDDCDEESTFENNAKDAFRICKTLIEDAPTTYGFIDGNRFFPQDGQKVIIFTGSDYVIAKYDKTFGKYIQRFSDDYNDERTIIYDIWNIRWWSPLIELDNSNN